MQKLTKVKQCVEILTEVVQKSGYYVLCCSAFHYASCVCSISDLTGGYVTVSLCLYWTTAERHLVLNRRWSNSFEFLADYWTYSTHYNTRSHEQINFKSMLV